MIEQETHQEGITSGEIASMRVFQHLHMGRGDRDMHCFLWAYARLLALLVNIAGMISPVTLDTLNAGVRLSGEYASIMRQFAVGFNRGKPHVDATHCIA